MEGGKTRIYKQNLSRLIRLTDFFGITDSSGLTPLSQIRDNGIINNGKASGLEERPSVLEQLKEKPVPDVSHKPPKSHPEREIE